MPAVYGGGIGPETAPNDSPRPRAHVTDAPVPVAAMFDPSIRGYPLNASGTLTAIHPVDQKVILALHVKWGTLASAADFGAKFHLLKRDRNLEAACVAEVNRALGDLLRAADIALRGITVTRPIPGRVIVVVSYVNLRLPGGLTQVRKVGF